MRHSTDTTGVDDFGGEAGELHDGHRLAVGGQAEQMADHFGHGVAADIGVVEHEGVARIVAHGLDARDQLVIDDARGAVLELAHALVDQRDQVDQAVGHRRIDGVADPPGIDALQPEADPVGVLVLGVDALRHRNDFGEDVELFGHAGAAAEQHVDDLLEIEQPERQLQVARVEHLGARRRSSGRYSLCTSSRKMRRFGRDFRISLSSSDTPVDLPTPVEPSTAKCLESISSTST